METFPPPLYGESGTCHTVSTCAEIEMTTLPLRDVLTPQLNPGATPCPNPDCPGTPHSLCYLFFRACTFFSEDRKAFTLHIMEKEILLAYLFPPFLVYTKRTSDEKSIYSSVSPSQGQYRKCHWIGKNKQTCFSGGI